MKRLLVVGVLAAVVAMFAHALTRESTIASPLLGRSAPDFEIPRLQPSASLRPDSTLSLGDLGGRPVVLNFWASWCLACRDEARVLEAGWRAYGPEVAFVGIAVDDEEGAARAFIERYGKTYLLGVDADGSVAIDYGLFGVPETFFIASDGRILGKHIGPLSAAELERRVAALRSGKPGGATGDPAAVAPLGDRAR